MTRGITAKARFGTLCAYLYWQDHRGVTPDDEPLARWAVFFAQFYISRKQRDRAAERERKS